MFGFGGSKDTAATQQTTTSSSNASTVAGLGDLGGSSKVQQLKAQVRQEMSVAHAQELVQTMTKHCFDACVPTPTDSLSAKQQTCVTQCMGLYTQAWSVIQRSYIERVQQEQSNGKL